MGLYQRSSRQILILLSVGCIIVLALFWFVGFFPEQNQQAVTLDTRQTVHLIGTTDNGKYLLFEEQLLFTQSKTALESIRLIAQVNTSYGGGFVTSINGISSTYNMDSVTPQDWFYYVNGILAPVGATYYHCHDGDRIRWDYHQWNAALATTAIIADFPEPFLHGYNGNVVDTTIVYTLDLHTEAEQLKQTLSNYGARATSITINQIDETTKATDNIILLGTYDEHPLIQDINSAADDIGLMIQFENNYVSIINPDGAKQQTFTQAGCIVAMQNHWNPKGNMHGENVIWMISGNTVEDVQQACALLCNQPEHLQHAVSVLIAEDEIIKVP